MAERQLPHLLPERSECRVDAERGARHLRGRRGVGLCTQRQSGQGHRRHHTLYDYAAIPNAYGVLPASTQIANEAATTRGAATAIFYQLKITQDGLLSLSYSLNGGAYQSVITG